MHILDALRLSLLCIFSHSVDILYVRMFFTVVSVFLNSL